MQISTSIDPASTLTDIDLINLAMAIEQVTIAVDDGDKYNLAGATRCFAASASGSWQSC